jgi:hypothetical protein
MKNSKHTPGPWKAKSSYQVVGKNIEINIQTTTMSLRSLEPVTHLIAAAPELLRELELLVNTLKCVCAGPVKSGTCMICTSNKTIKKAKGGES